MVQIRAPPNHICNDPKATSFRRILNLSTTQAFDLDSFNHEILHSRMLS